MKARRLALLGSAAAVVIVPVLMSPSSAAHGVRPLSASVDWPTYGDSVLRTGQNTSETVLSPTSVSTITQKWTYAMTAVVNTSPVEAAGVTTATGTQDLLYVGDEHGKFVALNAQTGALVWSRALGKVTTTCNMTPDKIFGVTGAAAIDRSTNRIYIAGGTGKLYALDLGTGATITGWPVTLTTNPAHEHVWGGLTVNGGDVYAELGGLCDIAPYRGRIIEVGAATHAIAATFYVVSPTKPYGGAIWGWGGASLDPVAGAVYLATGNALATPNNAGNAEAIVRLDTLLNLVASNKPTLNAGKDLDFGSTPVLFQATGCPAQLAAQNKDGELFIYYRDTITAGPAQRIQATPSAGGRFIGLPAWSDATQELYVALTTNNPPFSHGMLALSESAPGCTLTTSWNTPVGATNTYDSPPTVADGVVYFGNGAGNAVYAMDATTGANLWSSGATIGGGVFAAPIVVNGMLYVPSWDDKVHAYGP
jgi:outer membrane protein assembly factor BamB